MELIAILDFVFAIFIVFALVFQIVDNDKSKSMKKIKTILIFSLIWLLSESFCYTFDVPEKNFWINPSLLYVINLLPYVISSVVLISFISYCETYLGEKTKLNKFVFKIPLLILFINLIYVVIYYFDGQLVSYENGYYKTTGLAPYSVLAVYFFLICYPMIITLIKRKEVGRESILLLTCSVLPSVVSIFVIVLYGYDVTILLGAVSVSFIVILMQNESKHSRLNESLIFSEYFLNTYDSAYYIDFRNSTCKIYKRSDDHEKNYPIIGSYFDMLYKYINYDVHPDDREEMLSCCQPETLKNALKVCPEFIHVFRDISQGVVKTYRFQAIRGLDEDHAAFGFVDISDEMDKQNERFKFSEDSRKLIDNIAASYNVAYCVNMSEDSFRLLRMDDIIIGKDEDFATFSDVVEFLITRILLPSERDRMRHELNYETIRNKLSLTKSYNVEYRILLNGLAEWHEMKITSIDDNNIVIGFASKDLELIKRHLEEKLYDEFYTLFIVDIDTEMIKNIKNDSKYYAGMSGESMPYTEGILDFAKHLDGEAKDFFVQLSDLDYVKKELAVDNKRTYSYKSKFKEKESWIDVTNYVILRHDDGTPALFTLGFSEEDNLANIRQEMSSQLTEDMQMIGGLASEYHTLYYMNIDENIFKIYSLDGQRYPELKQFFNNADSNPVSMLRDFGFSDLIHPDDRKLFADISVESVRVALAHRKKYTVRFRRKYFGEYLWCEMDIVKYEGVDEQANALVVGFAIRDGYTA